MNTFLGSVYLLFRTFFDTNGGKSTVLFALLLLVSTQQYAATITSTTSGGNWSNTGTWVGGVIPTSGDAVQIASGATVTVDSIFTCLSLGFLSGTSNTVTISGSNSLIVTGDITFTNPSSNNNNQTLDIGAGFLSCTSLTYVNTSANSRDNIATISTGELIVNGNITMPGNANKNFFTCTGSANISITGNFSGSGSITPSTATFNFTGTSSQTLRGLNYHKLKFSGGGTKSISPTGQSLSCADTFFIEANSSFNSSGSGDITTNGPFIVDGQYTNSGSGDLITNGPFIVNGQYIESNTSGTVSINSSLYIGPTGELSCTVSENLAFGDSVTVDGSFASAAAGTRTFSGGLLVNGTLQAGNGNCSFTSGITVNGTFSTGTGTSAFQTNNQVISGSGSKSFGGNVQVNSITLTNQDSVVVTGNITGSGTFINATDSSYAEFNGNISTITLNAASAGNTIVLGRTGSNLIVPAITYHHLIIKGSSSTKNLSAHTVINGNFTIQENGTLNVSSGNYSITLYGNLTVDGTFIPRTTTSTLTMAGTNQSISGTTNPIALNNLTITNGNTTTLGQNISLSGHLNINSGGTLDISSSTANCTGASKTLTIAGALLLAGTTGGQTGSNFPTSFTTMTLTGGNVDYNKSDGAQTIYPGVTYNELTMSNTSGTQAAGGNLTTSALNLNNSGSELNMSTNTLTATTINNTGTIRSQNTSLTPLPGGLTIGGTVNYDANSGGQTIVSNTYTHLTLSNSSGTNTAGGNLTVNGTLTTTTGGTLVMGTNQLLGTLTTVNNTGTISTTNISATPLPSGKIWGGTIEYATTAGSQTIVGGSYQTLLLQHTSSTNTLAGDITVSTSLNMAATGTGTLTLGANTLTLGGTLNNMSSTKCFVANGSSNIVINGTGALGSNLYLDQTIPGTTNRLNNLTYNRASQTITLGDTIEITGTLTPSAGVLATSNVLKLISTSAATARVAQGSGSYITGNVIAERNIPASARRWRFLGSPVSGATLADLQNEIFVTGTGGASNGFDPTISNQASIYSYDETLTTGNLNTGWAAATHITNPITVGKGYRIFIRGDRSDTGRLNGTIDSQNEVTVNLIGPLNTGNIMIPVSFSSSGVLADDGWNLVSNPYASPFDWNAFYDNQNGLSNANGACIQIDPTIYIFNATSNTYSFYNALSNAGTVTGGVIPSGAAFWVKASAASPSLILSETYKTSATPIGVFKTNENEGFKIRLEADSISYDELVIKYMTGSTANKDNYDIPKLAGTLVNISAYGTDTQYLSGSVRPPVNNTNDTIQLGVYASATGTYTLRFYNSNEVAIQENVLLFDTYANTITDLLTTNEYVFTVNTGIAATQGDHRFYIVVANNTGLPVTLLSFGAHKEKHQTVRVNWGTIQEINHDYFEVERSSDGHNFITLTTIAAQGTSNRLKQYTWVDEQPLNTNYYRLKQVDRDGSVTYSQTVVIEMDIPSTQIQLYPVPAIKTLTVSHNAEIKTIRISDLNGILQHTVNSSGKQVTLDIEHLSTGVYILEVINENGQTVVERFVKQ